MAYGVLVVENDATKELLTMPLANVTVTAADYAKILAGSAIDGTIAMTFSKSTDRYNAIKAELTYDDNI